MHQPSLLHTDSTYIPSGQWARAMLQNALPFPSEAIEIALIDKAINAVFQPSTQAEDRRLMLAAMFDLVVAAEYYRSVAHQGWLYCPDNEQPLLLYPYTSACPRCVITDTFVHHDANKPPSGAIGTKTAKTLALFMQRLLHRKGRQVRVLKGSEPVDVIFAEDAAEPPNVFFAEIKAAPLLTMPLAALAQESTVEVNGETQASQHHVTDNANLYGQEMHLLVPVQEEDGDGWQSKLYPLGTKECATDQTWAYRGMLQLLESNQGFLNDFGRFWKSAFEAYQNHGRAAVYWLTNACGQPSPRPSDWPRRSKGGGYESISDSKSSVGMDRTDDLKKATYQILKMGAEGKPAAGLSFKVGIVSNIHADRHFDDYLEPFEDIVWTRDDEGNVQFARDLPPDSPVFNLFDGIVTLTQTIARDDWIEETFDFDCQQDMSDSN